MIPAFVLGSLAAPLTERDQYTWEAASANDSKSLFSWKGTKSH